MMGTQNKKPFPVLRTLKTVKQMNCKVLCLSISNSGEVVKYECVFKSD